MCCLSKTAMLKLKEEADHQKYRWYSVHTNSWQGVWNDHLFRYWASLAVACNVGEPCHKNNRIQHRSCFMLMPMCPLVVRPILIEAQECNLMYSIDVVWFTENHPLIRSKEPLVKFALNWLSPVCDNTAAQLHASLCPCNVALQWAS